MVLRLSSLSLRNLRESGLTDATIEAAAIKDEMSDHDTAALLEKSRVAGYMIPYVDTKGGFSGHYRIRVLAGSLKAPKYIAPAKTGNHVYLPPGLPRGWLKDTSVPLVIAEGEKKALAATQSGIPTLGIGGVDSWRTRTFRVPVTSVIRDNDALIVKVGEQGARELDSQVAPELLDVVWHDRRVVIVYDSDAASNSDVQRAAFDLGLWLDTQGAEVGQFYLSEGPKGEKRGLDDFLMETENQAYLMDLLEDPHVNFPFPMPTNPKPWVQKELADRPTRDRQRRVARGSLSYLDAIGRRYKDTADNFYFFEDATKILHPFRLDNLGQLRQSTFGSLLVNRLGMQTADQQVMSRLADLFTSQTPIQVVEPKRVLSSTKDTIYYQLSDGRMAIVTAEDIEFADNGTAGQLFLPETVKSVDEDSLRRAINKVPRFPSRWLDALQTVNLRAMGDLSIDHTRKLLATLFYLSPWLNRWRGMMCPLEIAVAEPNSGKTFLYNLRKGVLTGSPDLEGLQDDYRGWVTAISSAPAMWVCDNLGSVRTDFWHRLNDELARLITDPHPTVELRKLYTTSSISRIPIHTTFAITSIKNPFTAPDILQRSLIFELEAIPVDRRNGNWYTSRMAARTEWLAEQLVVIQRFLKAVQQEWDPNYISGYRLVNFEQALLRMGEVLGYSNDMIQIVGQLPGVVARTVADYDPIVEALVMFVEEWGRPTANISDIVDWVQGDSDRRYSNIKTLGNSILLGRYIKSHTYDIEQSTGMKIVKKHNATALQLPSVQNGKG
jgi:hypothetical protein